ncbi:5-methylcytosine-specific restriction protein A [Salinibacter ruber]|uniref:HNH endonuclease n=1 Tax=Salinibacter ruber TaxID=146919 RepID=UPI00160E7D7F|nr:HNH endonuclease signature motif containing protein [Salinibacter ruber]MBB4069222.1 5-methylcytosine-specific restriction protein A [Salinibacter ruber]
MPDSESSPSFKPGRVYNRREDLHGHYGGQRQGGISTPADRDLIFLFTSAAGQEYGYKDEFRPDGIFWYTGEGQEGDMEMTRGNQSIRDHQEDGKRLHLFEALGEGQVRYIGRATYLDHHWEDRPDAYGEMRSAVVFELAVEPTEDQDRDDVEEQVEESGGSNQRWWTRPQGELRALALQESTSSVSEEEARQRSYQRSKAVQIYVKKRADGICEGCGKEAPFVTPQERPYLETHHVRRVSDGGPDHPRWVIALCPNCHRRVHHGQDGETYNEQLGKKLGKIELSPSS